jgi:hypothetical protein
MPVQRRGAIPPVILTAFAGWLVACGDGEDVLSKGPDSAAEPRFSFFVSSIGAMRELSQNAQGFGGDLRFGETGEGAGLRGADAICRTIAERSLPGAGAHDWRAFLSATAAGEGGEPVHASERIGAGPWYDRLGRLVASGLEDLLQNRPRGANAAIVNDLPNEDGTPNGLDGRPGCTGSPGCNDNHDVLTGTGPDGQLYSEEDAFTCRDWTSAEMWGSPWCGHSWPRQGGGTNWMSSQPAPGCAPGVHLTGGEGPIPRAVGTTGGYGAIYCFVRWP